MSRFIPNSAEFRKLVMFIDGLRDTDFMAIEIPKEDMPDRETVRMYVEWLHKEGFIELKKRGANKDGNTYVATKIWDSLLKQLPPGTND